MKPEYKAKTHPHFRPGCRHFYLKLFHHFIKRKVVNDHNIKPFIKIWQNLAVPGISDYLLCIVKYHSAKISGLWVQRIKMWHGHILALYL